MTPEQKREQAISFVYGQLASNPNVTRELVAEVYDNMAEKEDARAVKLFGKYVHRGDINPRDGLFMIYESAFEWEPISKIIVDSLSRSDRPWDVEAETETPEGRVETGNADFPYEEHGRGIYNVVLGEKEDE